MRRTIAPSALAFAAALVLAAGCSEDVDVAEAEAAMSATAVDVVVAVSGDDEPGVVSRRVACQDDLLRDNGKERASVEVVVNVGADRDEEQLQQAIVDALRGYELDMRQDGAGVTYATAPTYHLSVQYYPQTGALAADGTTGCG